MKTKAVYPGTFDPITFGHIDVIKRASKMFDNLIIAITDNPAKKPFFSLSERKKLVLQSISGYKNVSVQTFSGLLVDFARKQKADIIIRGLREMSDFPTEFQQAIINKKLFPEIETVFIMTSPEFFYFSSSAVKELARHGADISGFVPKNVQKKLLQKIKQQKNNQTKVNNQMPFKSNK